MTTREVELLEKFIDLKLKRALAASTVAISEMEGSAILQIMVPIETELEQLRNELTVLKLELLKS